MILSMAKSDGYKEFVLDQLADLEGLTCRAMFGGHGLARHGSFSVSFIRAACISERIRPRPRCIAPST